MNNDKNKRIKLMNICYDYISEVLKVTNRINKLFNVESIWDIQNKYDLYNFRFHKDNVEVLFHGNGVCISENDEELFDIEYGCDIEVCGIDTYRLFKYIKSKIEYSEYFKDEKELEKNLNQLLKFGNLKKISYLYYINDQKNRQKLKKYKHNNK